LRSTVSRSDAEARARSLFLVGCKPSRVAIDASLRPRRRYWLVVEREGADAGTVQEQRFEPVRSDFETRPLGDPVRPMNRPVRADVFPVDLRGKGRRREPADDARQLS